MAAYVYNGMSKDEMAKWIASMDAGVGLPKIRDFIIDEERDKGPQLKWKQDKIAKFLADRKAEIREKAKKLDKYKSLFGVTWTKGEAQDESALKDDDGSSTRLAPEHLEKLDGLIKSGVFSKVEDKAKKADKSEK
jgi:hypothetical protein